MEEVQAEAPTAQKIIPDPGIEPGGMKGSCGQVNGQYPVGISVYKR
jgi:hypothetical protein